MAFWAFKHHRVENILLVCMSLLALHMDFVLQQCRTSRHYLQCFIFSLLLLVHLFLILFLVISVWNGSSLCIKPESCMSLSLLQLSPVGGWKALRMAWEGTVLGVLTLSSDISYDITTMRGIYSDSEPHWSVTTADWLQPLINFSMLNMLIKQSTSVEWGSTHWSELKSVFGQL